MLLELCVRVVDKIGTTTRLDAACTKLGDVIDIQPVGCDWGTAIVGGNEWRILKVNLPITLANALLKPESGDFPYREKRKRRYMLDSSLLTTAQLQIITVSRNTVVDLTDVVVSDFVVLKGAL